MTIQTKNVGKQHIIYHQHAETKSMAVNDKTKTDDIAPAPQSLGINLFNTEYLLSSDKIYRQATGRGQTYFFSRKKVSSVKKNASLS